MRLRKSDPGRGAFDVKTIREISDRFGNEFTESDLDRLESEEKKRDLGEEFFADLTEWIETLRPIKVENSISKVGLFLLAKSI